MKREITVVQIDAFQKRDPVDECLDIWVRWMHLKDHQTSMVEGNPQDTKDFMRAGEAVDTMIGVLPRVQWWAIRKARGLCTAWIFKDDVFASALQDAKETLEPRLRGHVATRRYFN